MNRPLSPTKASPATSPAPHEPPRRNFLTALAAMVFGGISAVIPVGAGLAMLLDPVFKRRAADASPAKPTHDSHALDAPFLRVASLEALPADGTPVQVPVIADLADAWNREVNQPVGAVYLSRTADGVACFNAICPHAGCFVAYSAERKLFQCPCHTSSFECSGQRILPSPSPRDMDSLAVDPEKLKQGEVWVQFVNFYPGKEEREAKS